jgi:hypothetical protein
VRNFAGDPRGGRSSRVPGGLTPDSIMWRRSNVDHDPTVKLLMYGEPERDCPPGRPSAEPRTNSPFEILRYAERRLADLKELEPDWDGEDGQPPTTDSIIAMHQAIKGVSDRRTVYPFLNPDGSGGIIAEWHAEGKVLEISADEDGETYLYGKSREGDLLIDALDEDAATMDSTGYAHSNRRRFRKILVELSLHVHRANPAWRELFK